MIEKVAAGATLIIPPPSMSGIAIHMDPAMQLLHHSCNLYVDQGGPKTPKRPPKPPKKKNLALASLDPKTRSSKKPKKYLKINVKDTLNGSKWGVFTPMVVLPFSFVTPRINT